jgi:hypothetical protein
VGTDLSGQPSSWLRQRCPGLMAEFAARGQQRAALHICKGTCRGVDSTVFIGPKTFVPLSLDKTILTPLCLFGFYFATFSSFGPFSFPRYN